jgi:hypothetical protein
VGCAHGQSKPTTAPETGREEALEVEIKAIRSMLENSGLVGSAKGWVVVIEPIFAHAGHAPGSLTGTARPAARHDALTKAVVVAQPTSGDTLRVRASDPSVYGESATISVTIGYNRQHVERRRRAGYQTDEFGLRRTANGWVVVHRTNLGIT